MPICFRQNIDARRKNFLTRLFLSKILNVEILLFHRRMNDCLKEKRSKKKLKEGKEKERPTSKSWIKCFLEKINVLLTSFVLRRGTFKYCYIYTRENTFYLQVTTTCSKYLVSLYIRKFIINLL